MTRYENIESLLALILLVFFLLCLPYGRSALIKIAQSLFMMIFFFLSGILSVMLTQLPAKVDVPETDLLIRGVVISSPEEKANTYALRLKAELLATADCTWAFNENLMVYLRKDSIVPVLHPGQPCIVRGDLKRLRNRGNPGEFDYAAYLSRRAYNYMVFTDEDKIKLINEDAGHALRYVPQLIRERIMERWDQSLSATAILSALTLGDKQLLLEEQRDSFAHAGAMHLLAVSGLHVGMVWWVLDRLLFFFQRKKVLIVLKAFCIVSILWFYAAVTGFSESVTRSVTMFSLISIAKTINRGSNILNTLFLAALIMLVIKPCRVYEAGFQLSFLAVSGIVIFQPLLKHLFKPRYKISVYVWDLFTVSLAAQFSTLALSLYYFHLFPLWFLFTNLFAIPLVSLILALFVIFSPLFVFDVGFYLPDLLLLKISSLLELIIQKISLLPLAVISSVSISATTMITLLLLVYLLAALFYYRRSLWLVLSFLVLSIMLFSSAVSYIEGRKESSILVYNIPDCSAVLLSENAKGHLFVFSDSALVSEYAHKVFIDQQLQRLAVFSDTIIYASSSSAIAPEMNLAYLCEGIWAFSRFNRTFLYAGSCSPAHLERVLSECSWNMILLSSGFPFSAFRNSDTLLNVQLIGDGTLRTYENDWLKGIDADAFLVKEQGAYYMPYWASGRGLEIF